MIRRFFKSAREHELVAYQVSKLAREALGNGTIRVRRRNAHTAAYLQRNVFSILFLSVYESLGIPRPRRMLYGMVNRCLRGVVTAADNLLDDEYKDVLELQGLPEGATTYKSVLQLLTFDRVLSLGLHQAVVRGDFDASEAQRVSNALLQKLAAIGKEEAVEEAGIEEILPPEEIIQTVHVQKGSNLLKLSFVAPSLLESGLIGRIRLCERGIHEIGTGLQILDDVTDFRQDIERKNHNYFISCLYHNGDGAEHEALDRLRADPEDRSAASVLLSGPVLPSVVDRAVGHSIDGFSILNDAGHWLHAEQAFELIAWLFKSRGLAHLWARVH
ncbi:MAG: hypothetical protein GXP25_15655 [Planctomycetes bacterium]|nr:hypothetical protein [Planctomycetota bacterium]